MADGALPFARVEGLVALGLLVEREREPPLLRQLGHLGRQEPGDQLSALSARSGGRRGRLVGVHLGELLVDVEAVPLVKVLVRVLPMLALVVLRASRRAAAHRRLARAGRLVVVVVRAEVAHGRERLTEGLLGRARDGLVFAANLVEEVTEKVVRRAHRLGRRGLRRLRLARHKLKLSRVTAFKTLPGVPGRSIDRGRALAPRARPVREPRGWALCARPRPWQSYPRTWPSLSRSCLT